MLVGGLSVMDEWLRNTGMLVVVAVGRGYEERETDRLEVMVSCDHHDATDYVWRHSRLVRGADYVIRVNEPVFIPGLEEALMKNLTDEIYFVEFQDVVGCMRIFGSYLFDPLIDATRETLMDVYRKRMRRFSPHHTLHI